MHALRAITFKLLPKVSKVPCGMVRVPRICVCDTIEAARRICSAIGRWPTPLRFRCSHNFIDLNPISMGWCTGSYGSKKRTSAPLPRIMRMISGDLWRMKPSSSTTLLSFGYGCSTGSCTREQDRARAAGRRACSRSARAGRRARAQARGGRISHQHVLDGPLEPLPIEGSADDLHPQEALVVAHHAESGEVLSAMEELGAERLGPPFGVSNLAVPASRVTPRLVDRQQLAGAIPGDGVVVPRHAAEAVAFVRGGREPLRGEVELRAQHVRHGRVRQWVAASRPRRAHAAPRTACRRPRARRSG
mmetsp:Transcript_23723/g.58683  ORF Transcript_23723/g.58683 Transcript_23723/m.58683 type:complete len:304 (-) Transcript_23723:314-1225(-)